MTLHSDEPGASGPSNPYAAPDLNDPFLVDRDQLTQLTVVATVLLSMAMLTLALGIVGLGFNLVLGIGFNAPPNMEGRARIGYMLTHVVWPVIQLIFQVLVILGAIAMIRRRGIALAWAGTICSLVPFCGPCLGLSIPFAIWGCVLLYKPAVKAAFS